MIGQILDRLTDEVRRIWCYRWLVAAVTATLTAAAVAFTFIAPNIYEAWGQLYVSRQTPLSAAAESVSLADLRSSNTYVVQKTLLNDDNLEAVARALEPRRRFTKLELASATIGLKKGVHLVDGGDGFVEIRYTDTDSHRAQAVVQLILNQFMSGSYERSQQDLRLAGAFLDQQISFYGDLISQSQAKIATIRGRWGVIAPDAGADAAIAPAQPQERAPAEVIQLPPPSPPARSEAAERVSQLDTRLASLLAVDTEQHPDVVAARRQLEEARAQSKTEVAEIVAGPLAKPPPAPLRRLKVRRHPAPPPEAAAELAELQRKDELLRASHQQLVAKRAAAQMSQAVSGADRAGKFLVTREPARPTVPVGPNRKLYLGVGILAALGGGLGAGYLRALMRGIMVSPREIEEVFQLPVIGTVSLERAWRTRPPFSGAFDSAHPPPRRQRRLHVNVPVGKAS
ncbi:MAG: chain length-determining protein [Caulobacteraceae bacterium]|nr:chain length-determining protein [Caulobacteraceae bacterium]